MPTLQNISGASLVANPQAFGSGVRTGFGLGQGMRQSRLEDEQRQADADWDARVDGLSEEALAGNQEALLRIFKTEPEYAKGIAGILQGRSVADATKLRDKGNEVGRFAGGLLALGDDAQAQTQAMMIRRNEMIEEGDTGGAEELTGQINMMAQDPASVRFGWQQDVASAQDADSILKVFSLDGGDQKSDQVQSSSILPGGGVIKVMKSGDVKVEDPQGNPLVGQDRANAIKDAENRGVDLQAGRAGARTQATKQETRAQGIIDRGVSAAESTATLRRGLELLGRIETGGANAISLATKRRLGMESADEGELSNALAKSVLSQLRETFGAAFTESEGARLERIEAGLGKSTAANKRLLQQTLRISERAARRAISAAKSRGDKETVADIEDLLSFSLGEENTPPAAQDQQAIDWAQANPNDPRAAQILQMQGQ
ncbi:MAG: hypothetical protein V3R25_09940 [Nitrosomonadaceae bacterium]